jgi:hypothetical protein
MTAQEWERCTDLIPMLDFLGTQGRARKLRLFACACCRHTWDLQPSTHQLIVSLVEQGTDGLLNGEEVRRRLAVQDPSFLEHSWDDTVQCHPLRRLLPGGRPEELDDEELRSTEEQGHWFPAILLLPDAWRSARLTARGMRRRKELQVSIEPFKSRRTPCKPEDLEAWNAGWDEVVADWNAAREAAGETETAWQAAVLRDLVNLRFSPGSVDPTWLSWNGGTVVRLAERFYADRDFAALPVLADSLEDAGCADGQLLAHLRGPGPHVLGCFALDALLGKS